MKIIGIDGHMLGDHSGGNESYYKNILQNMIIPGNIQAYLFLQNNVDEKPYADKFKIVRLKSKNSFMRLFFEIPFLARKLKLDVLHMQYFIPFLCPCKIVCTIHDISFEHFSNIFTKKEYLRQKLLIPYAAKHSKAIFTVSENAKKDIIEHYLVPENKIIVTYNAVNDNFKKLSDSELNESQLREQFQIGNQEYILSVCNLQPRKNLVRLIKAYKKMKKEYNTSEKLVIVGKKAWMFNDILQEALDNNEDIIFTDYVSERDLVRLYNAARCFVYPSFYEGFGIPPLEAMACGTPVAVANATSLPEVVGDAGIYFDPYEEESIEQALYELICMEESRRRLYLHRGAEQVKKFSWSMSASKIVDVYNHV